MNKMCPLIFCKGSPEPQPMWFNISLFRGECMVDDDCSLETACLQVEIFPTYPLNHRHDKMLPEHITTFTIFDLQHHCIDPCTTGTCRAADFCRVSFHFDHYSQVSTDGIARFTFIFKSHWICQYFQKFISMKFNWTFQFLFKFCLVISGVL